MAASDEVRVVAGSTRVKHGLVLFEDLPVVWPNETPALLVIGSVDMIARRFVEGMASADIDDLLCIKIGGEGDNGEVMIDLLARAILAATDTGGTDGQG